MIHAIHSITNTMVINRGYFNKHEPVSVFCSIVCLNLNVNVSIELIFRIKFDFSNPKAFCGSKRKINKQNLSKLYFRFIPIKLLFYQHD